VDITNNEDLITNKELRGYGIEILINVMEELMTRYARVQDSKLTEGRKEALSILRLLDNTLENYFRYLDREE
jgi:hypothetical protein